MLADTSLQLLLKACSFVLFRVLVDAYRLGNRQAFNMGVE